MVYPTRFGVVLFLVLLGACSDMTRSDVGTDHNRVLRTAADSAAFHAELRASGSITGFATGEVTADSGDVVTIIVTRTNCAADNVITITGVITGTVSEKACQSAGSIVTFGPATQSGAMIFEIQGSYGRGRYRVEGTHPSYIVRFDDGWGDGDFDDVVLWVRCTSSCDLLRRPSGDALIDHPLVQSGLKDIWEFSDSGNPDMFTRHETGMWIVENGDGTLTWELFESGSGDRCRLDVPVDQMTRINESGRRVVGVAHTHPHDAGNYPNPRNCQSLQAERIRINHGMSRPDVTAARRLGIPSYVIDRGHVHRAQPDGRQTHYPRDPDCR